MSNLWQHHKYLCPDLPFIISGYIREYDIVKANINVLYKYGMLTKEQYEYYLQCPRMEREVAIGNLQKKDYKYTQILQQGILEAKRLFFEANNILDTDILAVKNDAVFLINKIPKYTTFDNIEFANKEVYTSYYKLMNCEFYYFYNEMNHIEKLNIKGIDKDKIELHKEYFLDFLLTVFQTMQVGTVQETLELMNLFYERYINLQLDKGYYREFNAESGYRVKKMSEIYNYVIPEIAQKNLIGINTGYNLNIIRQLMSYYSMVAVDHVKNNRSAY